MSDAKALLPLWSSSMRLCRVGGGAAAPGDDLFYGVAPVDGLFGRGCGTAVSRQYVQQRAGHREQENQSQPHGRRSGYPLPACDDETRAERP